MADLLSGNLLTLDQQSLEGVLSWSNSTNGTIAIDSTQAYDDTHSLALTAIATGGAQFSTGTGANSITSGIVIGQDYTVSARVYSATNVRNIRVIANYYNGSGGVISQRSVVIGATTVGSFSLVSLNGFVIPAATTKIELLFVAAGNNAGEIHYFDQLYFGIQNVPPVVNAGADQSVAHSTLVLLNGSATDANGDSPLSYVWSIDPSYTGPAITLSDAATQNASFTSPSTVDGLVVPVVLTVTDPGGASGTDQVNISIAPTTDGLLTANQLTLAQQSMEGSLKWSNSTNGIVQLDTTYAYDGTHALKLTATTDGAAQFTTGTGANAVVGDFTEGRVYTAAARVRSSTARTIKAIVNFYNGVSIINQVNVTLGTSSTTEFATLSAAAFTVPAGTTKVEVLFNVAGNTAGDAHWFDELYFGYQNLPPTVNAGANQAVEPGVTVTLTATASDLEGDTLTYLWEPDAAYTGPALSLSAPTSLTTSFIAPASVNGYDIPFNFTATDTSGSAATDQVLITVYAGPWVYKREGGVWVRRKLYRRQGGMWIWP